MQVGEKGSAIVPLAPTTQSKIYWVVSVPKMLYDMNVFPISDRCIDLFEKAHRHHALVIQNLPKSTPKHTPLATLGWISLGSYIAYKKIMFMLRILCLPADSLNRQIMILCINSLIHEKVSERLLSSAGSMYKCVKSYKLEYILHECINKGSYENFTELKKKVKRTIMHNETQRWRASCLMYKDICVYSDSVDKIQTHVWWAYVRHNITMNSNSNSNSKIIDL